MTNILIDINFEIIPIEKNVVSKSPILTEYFCNNPSKALRLDFKKLVIEKIIDMVNGKSVDRFDPQLLKLCEFLGIQFTEPMKENTNTITEMSVPGIANYIFNSLMFSESSHIAYIEYFTKSESNDKEQQNNVIKRISISTNIKLINDCNNLYLNMIKENNTKELIFIDEYNIKKIVESSAFREITINNKIFDEVIKMLIEYHNNNTLRHYFRLKCVIEVQKKYDAYVVKIKSIGILH